MIHLLSKAAAQKLSLYLKDRITEEQLACFSFVLDSGVAQDDIYMTEHELDEGPLGQHPVIAMTKTNAVARTCVELALFSYVCPFAEEIFGLAVPGHGSSVSIRLSALVLGMGTAIDADYITDAYVIIRHMLLPENLSCELMHAHYYADFTFISLLQGRYAPSPNMESYVSFLSAGRETDEMILWEAESESIASRIRAMPSAVTVVCGEFLSGRSFFAAYTAKKCGLGIFMVDFSCFLDSENQESLEIRIRHVVRDCFLLGCALGIRNVPKGDQEAVQERAIPIIRKILDAFSYVRLPVFLTAESETSILPHLAHVCLCFKIPKLDAAQSLKAWGYFCKKHGLPPSSSYEEVGSRVILPVGKIEKAVRRLSLETGSCDVSRLSKLCYELIDMEQYKGLKRIQPTYNWEDLKLAEPEKKILRQICSHAVNKDIIMDRWGMGRYYAYGSGISALFTGAPGTGKTMAAHVIANELHMALYQIDLSQVLDKYIGETEKHLEEIFLMAEKGNAILFLDEADALLGKRSELNSAQDRYSNNEMAYILQRVESFDGIILMATNLATNIDPAFMRRVRYVVNFSMPDSELREQIWRSLFHERLPHEEIDFEFLSSNDFDFSGASIKNIMMNAMVNASMEKVPLSMKHLVCCIREEYKKMGVTVSSRKWERFSESYS